MKKIIITFATIINNLFANFSDFGPYDVLVIDGDISSSNGELISYKVFEPDQMIDSPHVILSHGFFRNQSVMTGFAEHFASWGIRVLTMNLLHSSFLDNDPIQDAQDLNLLSNEIFERRSVIYVGHSAGGLRSILAAAQDSNTVAVFGMDLVDILVNDSFLGQDYSQDLSIPLWGIFGEESLCNSNSNGLGIFNLAANGNAIRIIEADHCDFELPTNLICTSLCQYDNEIFSEEEIRTVILNLTTSFLLWQTGLNIEAQFLWDSNSEYYQSLIFDGAIEQMTTLSLDYKKLVSEKNNISYNYPNPFNSITSIRYNVSKDNFVNLSIYDFKGNNIMSLVNKFQTANSYSVSWNGKNNFGQKVSSGVYLYVVTYGKLKVKKKMILLK